MGTSRSQVLTFARSNGMQNLFAARNYKQRLLRPWDARLCLWRAAAIEEMRSSMVVKDMICASERLRHIGLSSLSLSSLRVVVREVHTESTTPAVAAAISSASSSSSTSEPSTSVGANGEEVFKKQTALWRLVKASLLLSSTAAIGTAAYVTYGKGTWFFPSQNTFSKGRFYEQEDLIDWILLFQFQRRRSGIRVPFPPPPRRFFFFTSRFSLSILFLCMWKCALFFFSRTQFDWLHAKVSLQWFTVGGLTRFFPLNLHIDDCVSSICWLPARSLREFSSIFCVSLINCFYWLCIGWICWTVFTPFHTYSIPTTSSLKPALRLDLGLR